VSGGLARAVVRFRWLILCVAVLVVVVGATWGRGVFGALTTGGFDDPDSESARASQRIATSLGQRDVDLIVLCSSDAATVDAPAFRRPVIELVAALRQRPEVAQVLDYYDAGTPAMVSRNRHATYLAITLRPGDDDGKRIAYQAVNPMLTAPGIRIQVGGVVAFRSAVDDATRRDIARGELLALPVVLALLILIFGGLVAASTPLLIGILAILGALTTTRLIAAVTDVSTFAVNTITLLGLGLAIDYSLLIVGRFREELHGGYGTAQAIARTMATAGRTAVVSGITIALALSTLAIFPQVFLRSMALGGTAAVLMATIGAVTVLPALLAVLGPRINAGRMPLPWRRRPAPGAGTRPASGGWARLADSVMRHPVWYLVLVAVVLSGLSSPVVHARFAGGDERVLPPGNQARAVSERIVAEFPGGGSAPILVLVEGAPATQLADLLGEIRALPEVTGAQVVAEHGDVALISVTYPGERTGPAAYRMVRAIRGLPTPDGARLLVGGRPAQDVDLLASLGHRLPWMAALMALVTLILLFLAFGSVVLPVKAVLMNLLSIGASFGVIVWIFQDGHLADQLGFTATGFLQPNVLILVLAVLFGLATDYEVFLLSRVRESWDATGDNRTAVASGLQRTGRIITSAALLLIVVVAGFTTGDVVFAKLIGVGMMTAIVVDATLVVPCSSRRPCDCSGGGTGGYRAGSPRCTAATASGTSNPTRRWNRSARPCRPVPMPCRSDNHPRLPRRTCPRARQPHVHRHDPHCRWCRRPDRGVPAGAVPGMARPWYQRAHPDRPAPWRLAVGELAVRCRRRTHRRWPGRAHHTGQPPTGYRCAGGRGAGAHGARRHAVDGEPGIPADRHDQRRRRRIHRARDTRLVRAGQRLGGGAVVRRRSPRRGSDDRLWPHRSRRRRAAWLDRLACHFRRRLHARPVRGHP
jgi:trehalose monomycolate/heme transporter